MTSEELEKMLYKLNDMIMANTALSLLAEKESFINSQVVKQILVKKGICTAEEIQSETARVTMLSPTVKELDRQISHIEEEIGFKPDARTQAMKGVADMVAKMANGVKLTDEEVEMFNDYFKTYNADKEDE